jgi:penicillin-binding protein 1C
MRYLWRIILVSSVAVCAVILTLLYRPLPSALEQSSTGTLTLLDCRGREMAELASAEARTQFPRSLGEMGAWLPRVTVALEDHRFYQHGPVDWRASAAAALHNLRSRRIVSGGSTITQQLVKIARGRTRRSWLAKADETIAAWKLERRWSKEKILADYLNRSSYGNRRLGPEAAARAYFGKSARDLTLPEAVYLAGLPQAPSRFNPWTHPGQAAQKYARSLARLEQLHVIGSETRQLLAHSPPQPRRFDPPRWAPHFTDAIAQQNASLHGVVQTSLDLDLQALAEQFLRAHLAALNRCDISQGAIVILDNNTGAVRAMVGSSDYRASQINGATLPRSCGSTLKPFVYLRALDRRLFTAASLLPDTSDAIRDEYADYDPQNYNHRYLGPVRLREALACSLNVPAVFALSQLGARQTFFELQKWGFNFPRQLDDYGAGFVLGNAEVRLVDLAGAYATLARRGLAMHAKLLATEHHPMSRIASPEASAIITDILCDNQAREKTFGASSPLTFLERVAVKTGTSSGFRDAWTVGFNRDHTVAVWTGNFDGRPMRDTFAVRAASPLWAAIMHELLRRGDRALEPLRESEQLVNREVCARTGMRPSRFTQATIAEWFLKDTEPKQDSACSFTADGKLLLPREYASWCASSSNTLGAQVRTEAAITNPRPNAHYSIDPALPASQQMIELTAAPEAEAQWFVNGAPVIPQKDGRFFWPLAPGEWKLRLIAPAGTAEEVIFVE